jgi:hypothetical protein
MTGHGLRCPYAQKNTRTQITTGASRELQDKPHEWIIRPDTKYWKSQQILAVQFRRVHGYCGGAAEADELRADLAIPQEPVIIVLPLQPGPRTGAGNLYQTRAGARVHRLQPIGRVVCRTAFYHVDCGREPTESKDQRDDSPSQLALMPDPTV